MPHQTISENTGFDGRPQKKIVRQLHLPLSIVTMRTVQFAAEDMKPE